MRKILRAIKRLAPGCAVRVNGRNHYCVELSNGTVVVVSGTPSAQNCLRNAAADIRRESKRDKQPNERKKESTLFGIREGGQS